MTPLLLFSILIPLHFQVNSQPLSSDQTILLSLKQQWGNPASLKSWNSASSPCDWPEIECTSGSVTGLYLAEKNINGTIPSSICQLRNLVSINLSKNKISGYIPVCLYNCLNLESLDMSMNVLSGTIPGEFFIMKRLRVLSLHGNRLFGKIPTPIKAHSLESIDLSDNNLNGSIPDEISNLYNLGRLDLSMNSFSGLIPLGLFHLYKLDYLSLGYNNLSGELPADLNLFQLYQLNITHNHLEGTIPKSLGELSTLSALDLSENQLSGNIIENVFHLRSNTLRICSNKFLGKIPIEFVNQAFGDNCFDFSNLCSDNRTQGLPSCPYKLCSDNRIQRFLNCNSKNDESKKHLIIILLETVGCGVVGFLILYYFARKCWTRKHDIISARCRKIWHSGSALNNKEEWKMVSFQRLKFDKTDILSSLTDENLIGHGGSGKVYRVFINKTGNYLAVKSIRNDRKSDHRLEKEFLAEIQTLGTIRHYNIVKLLCYISGKDLKLLVYQYFENKSLDQWLHGNKREISSVGTGNDSSVTRLDWPMRLHIAIGVAQGLCYMHHHCSPPIIHRDIKSSNILLDSEFNTKIADFGLAKMLSRHGDTEPASAVAGTFGYIAPEYAYTTKVNTKIDVYSFGVVLLELTTGKEAVIRDEHMNLAGWAKLHYNDASAIAESLHAEMEVSIYLDQIIAVFRLGVICTATSPSVRPSMKDCLHILQNFSNNFSSSTPMTLQLSDYHSVV